MNLPIYVLIPFWKYRKTQKVIEKLEAEGWIYQRTSLLFFNAKHEFTKLI